jgi:hypothetical protein
VRKLLKRASSSFLGNVALWEVLFSAPLFLTFFSRSYTDGTLSAGWAAHLLLVSAGLGAVAATVFWFAVALPLIKSRSKWAT